MRVIFHIDELEKWELTLANVKNLLNYAEEYGETAEVEILANSKAVSALNARAADRFEHLEAMEELLQKQVKIVACQNALKKEKIALDALFTNIDVVPAGVAELAKKQAEGFAYIRP